MTEVWRPVVGHEGRYEVSDMGNVRSVTRQRRRSDGQIQTYIGIPLRPFVKKSGHSHVRLSDGKKVTTCQVHRLVLEAFVGPCPKGMEACHGISGVLDNSVYNLRWDTHSENMKDRKRHASGESGKLEQLARAKKVN